MKVKIKHKNRNEERSNKGLPFQNEIESFGNDTSNGASPYNRNSDN